MLGTLVCEREPHEVYGFHKVDLGDGISIVWNEPGSFRMLQIEQARGQITFHEGQLEHWREKLREAEALPFDA
jgi:hypothetical protein